MKKPFILTLMLLFTSFTIFAFETSYVINAYKYTNESITLNVYDTLSGSLTNLGEVAENKSNELDITNYVDALITPGSSTTINNPVSNSVFSIIVIGVESMTETDTTARSYSVTVNLGPMTNENDGTILPIYYELFNQKSEFTGSGSNVATPLGTITNSNGTVSSSSTDIDIVLPWTVQRTSDKAPTTVIWETRCAIAAAISQDSYDNASTGNYYADVTVTLEVN